MNNKACRLSEPQKRIWNIEQIYPNTSMHNIGGTVRIKGNIDFDLLRKAIFLCIKQNDAIRIRIKKNDNDVCMYVFSDLDFQEIPFIDFSLAKNSEDKFNSWVINESKKPFNLLNSQLYYFAVFRISESETGYYLKYHHIICDGFSTSLMTSQVMKNYQNLLNGEGLDIKILQPTYLDYLESEEKFFKSPRFKKSKNFWQNKFSDISEVILPRTSENLSGNRKTFIVDKTISKKIYEFNNKYSYSLNTFFISIYLIYLYRTTQQKDLVIGVPVLNRSGQKEKNTIGMYTSTVPLRIKIDTDISTYDFFRKVNSELILCYLNQRYPYNYLVRDLEFRKNGIDFLFDKFVNYYNKGHITQFNGIKIDNEDFYNWNQIYSFQMIIKECKDWVGTDNIALSFDYKVSDYSDVEIENIYTIFLTMIDQIIHGENRLIRDIDLLSKQEMDVFLKKFNNTDSEYPQNKLIHQLFEDQVLRTPSNIAVTFKNDALTYKELNDQADHLAALIRNKIHEQNAVVAVSGYHSIEIIIGILAILKSGNIFLPFDPNLPQERIEFILDEASVKLILTNKTDFKEVFNQCEIINLNDKKNYLFDCETFMLKKQNGSLAYILYTSGSVGKPKGVMVGHRSLVNYIYWAAKTYIKNEDDIFANFTSLSFDLTLTSIFAPLISGAQIKIYNPYEDEKFVLFRILDEGQVTIIKLTPAHLSLLKDRDNSKSKIKKFIVGGEDFKYELARNVFDNFNKDVEIYNEYGPTEATVGCMVYKFENDIKSRALSVPIGQPIDNSEIYILDKYLKPVPMGISGELFISGVCLAKGYLRNQELTDKCFLVNSFKPGLKMYKSGDFARFIDKSKIEYLGRGDNQIKIRGYRVELQEIEECLSKIDGINNSIVTYLEDKDTSQLCAYIVSNSKLEEKHIKLSLSKSLPSYMIPGIFIFMDSFPLTSNGKVNRKMLPKPNILQKNKEYHTKRAISNNERALLSAITEVLDKNSLDFNANFFHYGGDSIKAIQLSSKLRERGLDLKVQDILSNPIIDEMVNFVHEIKNQMTISQSLVEGEILATPIIAWFFEQKLANPHFYNQSVLLALSGNLQEDALNKIIGFIIKHHDNLRLNLNLKTGKLFYNGRYLNDSLHIKTYDISSFSEHDKLSAIKKYSSEIKSSFHLEKTILFRACLFITGKKQNLLLFTAHHLIIDAVSWRIVLEDFLILLEQYNSNIDFELPLKTNSYLDWSNYVNSLGRNSFFESEIDYWNTILDNSNNYLPVISSSSVCSKVIRTKRYLSEELTQNLLIKANIAYSTKSEELLITAFVMTINEFSKKNKIVIELECNGRTELQDYNDINISRTIGWFTNIFPACFFVDETKNIDSNIKLLKEQIRNIPNKGYGYGVLKYIQNKICPNSSKYIRFNYLGDFGSALTNEHLCIVDIDHGHDIDERNKTSCLLEINLMIVNKILSVSFIYDANCLETKMMDGFVEMCINNITRIIDYCSNKEEQIELTPSDFNSVVLSQKELDSLFV